ncbi:MAG: hypothetical protein IKV77_11495 [Alistipes sp.]|nr:hypothetical protein [Alistipes sp.]MBR6550647.1 hypothetical protein [Paludibacteraceae bacterium]
MSIETTYKQEVKEASRRLLWQNAVRAMTQNRTSSRVINPNYMDNLWEYCKEEMAPFKRLPNMHDGVYEEWKRYADIQKGTKIASELKVAFFCGPEPENDVVHLLELGVLLENIYAFEYDKEIFEEAVASLQNTYPSLKIFNGKIETYVTLNHTKFDIIYLDFTKSLISEYKVVAQIIDSNALSDMGVLIINTTYPDITDENVKFLAEYFLFRSFIEYTAIYDSTKDNYVNEGEEDSRFVESCTSHGIYDIKTLMPMIKDHFRDAYSAFQTNFVITYSNLIKPITAVLNNPILCKRLLTSEQNLRKILEDKKRFSEMEINYAYDAPLLYTAFANLSNASWRRFFENKENGMRYSRLESLKILEMFLYAKYEDYQDIMSHKLQTELSIIEKNIIEKNYNASRLFCDVPMLHLWLQLMILQMGYPYHHNSQMQKRFTYTAKTRSMCLDIFTLDTCRELYDSLSMMEYYSKDMSIPERQIVTRMCMDAIVKQTHWQLDQLYYGAHLIGINEKIWSHNHCFPRRINIQGKENDFDELPY